MIFKTAKAVKKGETPPGLFIPPEAGRVIPPPEKPRRVYIGTPANCGIEPAYHYSVVRLVVHAARIGLSLIVPPPYVGDSLVTRARDTVVDRFLRTDATDLLFIDADIDFQPVHVEMLLASEHDVVCGVYPKKRIVRERVVASAAAGADDPLANASDMVVNVLPETEGRRVNLVNECFPIAYAPTGFLLIRRHVFEAMAYAHPELLHVHDDGTLAPRFAFFQDPIVDCELTGIRRRLSEDWDFCRRWRAMGGKVYAHVGIELGHTGRYRFTGSLRSNMEMHDEPVPEDAA